MVYLTILALFFSSMMVSAAEKQPTQRGFGSINSGDVIAQVAVGDNRWSMEFIVMSLEDTTKVFTVTFHNQQGDLMTLPVEGLGEINVWADSVLPGGVRTIRTSNTGPLRQGYAKIESEGISDFAFYAVLTSSEPAGFRPPFRTFVPGMWRLQGLQRLFFNNTEGNVTCIALMSQAFLDFEEPIKVIARDSNGAELQRIQLDNLDRDHHAAFCLQDELPTTAGRRGVVDIVGDAAAIGFTFDPEGKFHTETPYDMCCFDIE